MVENIVLYYIDPAGRPSRRGVSRNIDAQIKNAGLIQGRPSRRGVSRNVKSAKVHLLPSLVAPPAGA